METASILQDSQNDTIQMDYTGGFSFAKNGGFSKGFGISFDVDYRIQTNENDHAMTFQLLAKNIGFMLPTQMTRYAADSSFQYTGFNLNQLVQQFFVIHRQLGMEFLYQPCRWKPLVMAHQLQSDRPLF